MQRAAQTVLGVYLKRTCSRVTSASSALGVLNDYTLYKSTHSLTHPITVRVLGLPLGCRVKMGGGFVELGFCIYVSYVIASFTALKTMQAARFAAKTRCRVVFFKLISHIYKSRALRPGTDMFERTLVVQCPVSRRSDIRSLRYGVTCSERESEVGAWFDSGGNVGVINDVDQWRRDVRCLLTDGQAL